MKKALIVLLAVALVGAFAFADDAAPAPTLTISGSGQSGIEFDGGNGAATTVKDWSSNNGTPGDAWLDLTYGGASAGGKIELYAESGAKGASAAAASPVGIDVLYGWWKPISMLTVRFGWNYGSTYATPIEGWANGGYGAQIAATPIDGLTAALDIDSGQAGGVAIGNIFGGDLQYSMKDIGTIGMDYDLGSKVLYAGVNVAAVPNLTGQIDFKYDTAASKYRAEEQVAYAIGAIKPGVWAYESSIAGDPAFGVKPWVNYTLGAATLSAYFQYNADNSWSAGPNVGFTVDKNSIYAYFDINSKTVYDLGLRYVVSF